jgi:hypothetical protein
MPPRVVVLAGASLLGLSLAVAVLLGPWAERWFLVALWLLAAGVFGYLGLRRRHVEPAGRSFGGPSRLSRGPVFALALGFAGLAAATAVRTLAGGRVALVWILYAVAGIGMVGLVVLVKDSYRPAPKQ